MPDPKNRQVCKKTVAARADSGQRLPLSGSRTLGYRRAPDRAQAVAALADGVLPLAGGSARKALPQGGDIVAKLGYRGDAIPDRADGRVEPRQHALAETPLCPVLPPRCS